MMYWILFVMGAMVCAVIALIVGGLATPRTHVVARAIRIPVPSDAVWNVIRDINRYHEWRHELEVVDVVETDQPQPRWRETRTNGSKTFGITVDQPPDVMVARILDEDLAGTGEWRWRVQSNDGHTTLSITETGTVGNPVFRFVQTYIIGFTKPIDAYLNSCARALGVNHVVITDIAPSP